MSNQNQSQDMPDYDLSQAIVCVDSSIGVFIFIPSNDTDTDKKEV